MEEGGFSMSFLDSLSLGLIGVIILYTINVNSSIHMVDENDDYNISIEQNKSTGTEHLAFVIVKNNLKTLMYDHPSANRARFIEESKTYLMGADKSSSFELPNKIDWFTDKNVEEFKKEIDSLYSIKMNIAFIKDKIPAFISIQSNSESQFCTLYFGFELCGSDSKDHTIEYSIRSLPNEVNFAGKKKNFMHKLKHHNTWKGSCEYCLWNDKGSAIPFFNMIRVDINGAQPEVTHFKY